MEWPVLAPFGQQSGHLVVGGWLDPATPNNGLARSGYPYTMGWPDRLPHVGDVNPLNFLVFF